MKKIIVLISIVSVVLHGCLEDTREGPKTPFENIAGDYEAEFEFIEPAPDMTTAHFRVFNVGSGTLDSLWVQDENVWESMVKVKWDGKNSFSITEGHDIIHGEVVNITGEIFSKDSIRVEWHYVQADPADDVIIVAKGKRFSGF
jgi:hypothetical protein